MLTERRESPLVSVGFPVFNEEMRLPAALDSILAQDYGNLEVIICDNSSTDATLELARAYASRDARIAVHANDVNRGASFNFNRCFELASGRYFTWASGHDTRHPEAIGKCVTALEDDLRLALCYPSSVWRRLDGTTAPVLDDGIDTRGLPPPLRLRRTIERLETCNAVHGVIRSEALAATRLFRNCFGSDHVLLAELSLLGEFRQLEEVLFVRSENRPPERDEERIVRTFEMIGGVDPRTRAKPYTTMGVEHMRGVWRLSQEGGRIKSTVLAASWYARRWWHTLAAEWHLARLVQVSAAAWRRLPSSRRARTT